MLNSLEITHVYDSSQRDIIQELIVPLLRNSREYWRGVGFFSSGWLKLTASGIEHLAKNGGKARFVTSPMLSENDIAAFQLASNAMQDQILYNTLKRNLCDIATGLERDTLNVLAWMLVDNIIEFKFAIPKRGIKGDYHDKVGVFVDESTNFVAFHGSFNDTYKGSLNGEAFSVFKSWADGQNIFAQEHFMRLKDLWENGNSQFDVFQFADALKHDFINMRNSDRPYSTEKLHDVIQIASDNFINKPHNPFLLKPYQIEAIAQWQKNDYHGIFEMATGTGKTITSLAAAVTLYQKNNKLFLVIIVPFLHLVEQWSQNCAEFNISALCCSGNNIEWRKKIKSLIMSFNLGSIDIACLIVVQDTASGEEFRRYIKKIPHKHFMLIADETHYLGAKHLRNALFQEAAFRLGLSATPDRWMDELGTDILKTYYKGVVYRFSLENAIDQEFLTPYEYYPIFVYLTEDELLEYMRLTKEIGVLTRQKKNMHGNISDIQEKLERKLLERARLVGKAENKLSAYKQLLKDLKTQSLNGRLSHLLTFCAPGTHKQILLVTSEQDVKCHEFVHDVSYKDRQSVLKAFASGHIEAVISIKCMDEGVDVPSTQTAILLASTTNPKEFIQRRGRVLRKFEGKSFAVIYDFIVMPPDGTDNATANSIIRRELPRFAEFSEAAKNKYFSRSNILPLLEKYDLQAFIDEKPWDIYKKDIEDNEV